MSDPLKPEPQTSGLDDFLAGHISDGTIESASQSFRLDPASAWRKLGQFQLPSESAWVLKVVQAACAARALELNVTLQADKTWLRISGVAGWTSQTVEQCLFEVGSKAPPELRHLCVAVRALAQQSNRNFCLTYTDGVISEWNGEVFTHSTGPAREVFALQVDNVRRDQVRSLFVSRTSVADIKNRTTLTAALTQECCYCPIPIKLDKVLVNKLLGPEKATLKYPLTLDTPHLPESSSYGWSLFSEAFSGSVQCSISDHPQKELYRWAWPSTRGMETRQNLLGLALLRYSMRLEQFGNETLHVVARQPAQVIWLHDGVNVAKEPLPIEDQLISLSLLILGDGLKTDLSGLALIESEEKRTRLTVACQQARKTVEWLTPEVRFEETGRVKLFNLFKHWYLIFMCCFPPFAMLALLALIFAPILGPVILGANFANSKRIENKAKQQYQELSSAFGELSQSLASLDGEQTRTKPG